MEEKQNQKKGKLLIILKKPLSLVTAPTMQAARKKISLQEPHLERNKIKIQLCSLKTGQKLATR